MKIAVVGSRNFTDKKFIFEKLRELDWVYNRHVFISGGAKGVDSIGELYIDDLNERINNDVRCECCKDKPKKIEKIIYKPDWNKHGKKAGFLRNVDIISNADLVLAFWDGESKGTKNSIDLAIKNNKPINIYVR